MADRAPLYVDVADAPEGGVAHWVTARDGLKLRAANWAHGGAKGTVLLFPGRTEYVEKYGRAAADLRARGYAMATIDWRGQGLADRLHEDAAMGHVPDFVEYQRDVAALVAYARAQGLPEPYHLLAHSMGGCIGLRSVMQDLPVKSAVFSAPMWGLLFALPLRPVLWSMRRLGRRLPWPNRYPPGQRPETYVLHNGYQANVLTSDHDMWEYMCRQVDKHPDLALGGPSFRWVQEALHEMETLAAKPAPDLPTLTFVGNREAVVDPFRIHDRMRNWPKGEIEVLSHARHEPMMESVEIRDHFFDRTTAHFDANS